MKLTIESMQHYTTLANRWMEYYAAQDIDALHVSISAGNDKIGHAWNVSTLPIITCTNCCGCAPYCYDARDCLRYGDGDANNVIKARAKNTIILMKARGRFFAEIEAFLCTRRKHKYFRWHVGGEIKDTAYALQIIDIAHRHADWVFWTYTKNYAAVNAAIDIVNARKGMTRGIPANLTIMFSEWRGMPIDNPHGMPEFRMVFTGDAEPAGFYCPGNCDYCKEHLRGCIARETTYCREH